MELNEVGKSSWQKQKHTKLQVKPEVLAMVVANNDFVCLHTEGVRERKKQVLGALGSTEIQRSKTA